MTQRMAFRSLLKAVQSGTLEELQAWARVCRNIEQPSVGELVETHGFAGLEWLSMMTVATDALKCLPSPRRKHEVCQKRHKCKTVAS